MRASRIASSSGMAWLVVRMQQGFHGTIVAFAELARKAGGRVGAGSELRAESRTGPHIIRKNIHAPAEIAAVFDPGNRRRRVAGRSGAGAGAGGGPALVRRSSQIEHTLGL